MRLKNLLLIAVIILAGVVTVFCSGCGRTNEYFTGSAKLETQITTMQNK